jgi:hypothetical protein
MAKESSMSAKLPYLTTPGTIDNALTKVKAAATPPTFNNDFVHEKLQIKGGAGKSIPPFFKKLGLVSDNGAPTALYQKLRNSSTAGEALGQAVRVAYRPLYEVNEYVHELGDKDLKGLILQVTGLEDGNRTAELIQATFQRLKKHAKFDVTDSDDSQLDAADESSLAAHRTTATGIKDLRIGYTINLNLPATTNVEVFDAIFQSLRKNLLRDE